MRIRYIVPFDRKIIVDDHWEIPIQGGKCCVAEKDGYAVALLSIGIASRISMKAADPIFRDELNKRHFEDAMRAGARIVYQIKFREPEDKFDRKHQVNFNMPGTKPTPRSAFAAAQQFLQFFQHNQPVSALLEAECTLHGSEEKIFSLTFHQRADADGSGQPS